MSLSVLRGLLVLLGVMLALGAVAATPYPRIETELRAALQDHLEDLDEAGDGLAAAAPLEHATARLFTALAAGQLPQAATAMAEIDALLAAAAASDEEPETRAEWLEETVFALLIFELLLEDPAFDWIALRLRPQCEDVDMVLALDQVQVTRALRVRNLGLARQRLERLLAQAESDCQRPEDVRDGSCELLQPDEHGLDLRSLARQLRAYAGGRGAAPAAQVVRADAEPLLSSGPRRHGPMLALMVVSVPDAVALALAAGDLDGAIGAALRADALSDSSFVDARLPDLLHARHGAAGLAREFELAAQRIHERTLPAGRVVVTTLFGHELRLPSATVTKVEQPDGSTVERRTEYTTLAEHQANLRRSALYRALFPHPEHDR